MDTEMAKRGWKTEKVNASELVVGTMIGISLGGAAFHARGTAVLATRTLTGTIVHVTEKAIRIEVFGQKNTTIWLPKSALTVEIPTDEHILAYYKSNGMLNNPNYKLASWFRPDAWQLSVFDRVETAFLAA